jgi:hypothetical protein
MAGDVIDLREWGCAKCGVVLDLAGYEGDASVLRCEECAEDLGPQVIRLSKRRKTRT